MRVVIRADKKVEHGRVIRVLDILKQAGLAKFAFGVAPVPRDDAAPAPAPN
jgi:biopolymer transport protein ExbD